MPAPLSDSDLIDQVLARHHLNQRRLAGILRVGEWAVCRWRQGTQNPTTAHRAALEFLATLDLDGVSR
jgi:DNA-binding transcriptional regulator YiaG